MGWQLCTQPQIPGPMTQCSGKQKGTESAVSVQVTRTSSYKTLLLLVQSLGVAKEQGVVKEQHCSQVQLGYSPRG